MLDFVALITAAQKRSGATSLRRLAPLIGRDHSRVAAWKRREGRPDDEALVNLCRVAGVDPSPWLMYLNELRATEPTKSVYRDILDRLSRGLVPLVVVGMIMFGIQWVGSAPAVAKPELYIMRKWLSWLFRRRAVIPLTVPAVATS